MQPSDAPAQGTPRHSFEERESLEEHDGSSLEPGSSINPAPQNRPTLCWPSLELDSESLGFPSLWRTKRGRAAPAGGASRTFGDRHSRRGSGRRLDRRPGALECSTTPLHHVVDGGEKRRNPSLRLLQRATISSMTWLHLAPREVRWTGVVAERAVEGDGAAALGLRFVSKRIDIGPSSPWVLTTPTRSTGAHGVHPYAYVVDPRLEVC